MGRFQGHIVVVTGAAAGQGASEARQLVAEGARVLLTDINVEAGMSLAEELGSNARFQQLDVASEPAWADAVAVAEKWGPISGLINNAGIFHAASIEDTTSDVFLQHVRINQLGPFLGMQAVSRSMRRRDGGAIVNISSTAGLHGTPGIMAYGATKWALRGMTKIAAGELGQDNIRVNSVHPGFIETGMTDFVPQDARTAYQSKLPLGRLVSVPDIVEAVLFLLSDAAASITGAELKIDSGAVL